MLSLLGRRATLFLLPLILGAPPASAQAASEWHRVSVGPFTWISQVSLDETRWLAEATERLRLALVDLAPSTAVVSQHPTRLYLFNSAESFREFSPPLSAGRGDLPAAFLLPHPHGNMGAIDRTAAQKPERVLYRQLVRSILEQDDSLPDWLKLGVSTFYSTFEASGNEVKIGLPLGERVQLSSGDDPEMTLERLLEADAPEETPLRSAFRTRAWSLTHYLLIGNDDLRPRVKDYLLALRQGEPPAAAFWDTFGRTADELEAELAAYQDRSTLSYLRLSLDTAPQIDLHSQPLEPATALAELGQLLVRSRSKQPELAEEYFRRALELDAEVALAWRGRGQLALLARKTEATPLLERALALEPGDAIARLLYGEALLGSVTPQAASSEEEKGRLSAAIEAFETATELLPEQGEVWGRLGYALNLDPSRADEAANALEKAMALLPPRPDVVYNLLIAYARQGKTEEARGLFTVLEARDTDPSTRTRAREILLQLDFNLARRLALRGDTDDAVALLARVKEDTTDESLRLRAQATFDTVAAVDQHNRFASLYAAAHHYLQVGDVEEAERALVELTSVVRPGIQTEILDVLKRKVAAARERVVNSGSR